MEYPTGTSPTDADAIAAATVQTSAVIFYTLYDSSRSQDVSSVGMHSCIRTGKSKGNRVVHNDRFSLVSVNVRVNRQHSGFETPVTTVGTVWESAADTWTSHAVIATADIGCLWCDWTMELDKGLDMVDKAGVGGKKWISQKWLSNETNKHSRRMRNPLCIICTRQIGGTDLRCAGSITVISFCGASIEIVAVELAFDRFRFNMPEIIHWYYLLPRCKCWLLWVNSIR